ncbi:toxin [Ramlibacter sp.]|uniref:toxin n=1 Tax=Ramlibacter sp. TaxID=1917967 RepID=UPI003D0FAE7E
MQATFIELAPFERHRSEYLDDDSYLELQQVLMANPEAGDLIADTGGLRKLRRPDPRRGKGKRGGLRVIYYWWLGGEQFWLVTVYDKDEASDLTNLQKKSLRELIRRELEQRD